MTDHDRARHLYRIAGGSRANGARAWFAERAGYSAGAARKWPDDCWPPRARAMLDLLERVPPLHWPGYWQAPH